jgi:hypothetical protein
MPPQRPRARPSLRRSIKARRPYLEPPVRIELTTYRLQGGCSTTELQRRYLTKR